MKQILIFAILLLTSIGLSAQVSKQLSKQEIETSETYTWTVNVDNKTDMMNVFVGFQCETVNTSDLTASFYIYGSVNGNKFGTALASEAYTWSSSSTPITRYLQIDSCMWPELQISVVATSDAQTAYVTPWVKTAK